MIAIVAPLVSAIREPQRGGSQAFVSDLTRGLVDRGHDGSSLRRFRIGGPGSRGDRHRSRSQGSGSHALSRVGRCSHSRTRGGREGLRAVYAAVRETRYDVVHNHAFDAPAITLATAAARAGRAHASPSPGRGRCRRAASRGSARPTPDGRSRIRAPGERLAPDRPGRRDPAAVRPDGHDPLVAERGRWCGLRRQTESGEGSRGGDRDRPGGRRWHRCLRR